MHKYREPVNLNPVVAMRMLCSSLQLEISHASSSKNVTVMPKRAEVPDHTWYGFTVG